MKSILVKNEDGKLIQINFSGNLKARSLGDEKTQIITHNGDSIIVKDSVSEIRRKVLQA